MFDELSNELSEVFAEKFEIAEGRAIPGLGDVPFDNQGRKIKLVSLFVDIRKSTQLVGAMGLEASARMYKGYLRGVTKIVNHNDGQILSFNGDGIVAGFVGPKAANGAVLSAQKICYFLGRMLKPFVDQSLNLVSAPTELGFDFGIGVDVGDVLVIKGGMRGEDNSALVWAGNPVNHSVKISSVAHSPYNIYVSAEVFTEIHYSLKMSPAEFMWDAWTWPEKNRLLWRSHWNCGLDHMMVVPDPPEPAAPRRRSLLESIYAVPKEPTLADILNPRYSSSGSDEGVIRDALLGGPAPTLRSLPDIFRTSEDSPHRSESIAEWFQEYSKRQDKLP